MLLAFIALGKYTFIACHKMVSFMLQFILSHVYWKIMKNIIFRKENNRHTHENIYTH